MKILFITNGHGEDTIAARIIDELHGHDISAFPIVGDGSAFAHKNINILGPRRKMPSGGFIYQSLQNMIKDLTSGLASTVIKEIRELRSLKGKFDIVVSIGDIVPIVGALFTKTGFIFVGCAKSDYYSYSYTPWEKFLLKNIARLPCPGTPRQLGTLKKKASKQNMSAIP